MVRQPLVKTWAGKSMSRWTNVRKRIATTRFFSSVCFCRQRPAMGKTKPTHRDRFQASVAIME